MSKIPNAIFENTLNIAGINLHCYVLDDGSRIIDMDGVNQLLGFIENGGEITMEESMKLAEFKNGKTVMEKCDE